MDNRVCARFGEGTSAASLADMCGELLSEQRRSWPELGQAYDSLDRMESRQVDCKDFHVRLVHNPGRAVNTTAAVSPDDISQRPCFLCPANLPDEQMAVAYDGSYFILANPRPAVASHLTIIHRDHRPQGIYEHTESFLQLARDFGGEYTVLYNGPRCGASAPDHLHFQAIPRGQLPIERELGDRERFIPLGAGPAQNGTALCRGTGFGREVVLIESEAPAGIAKTFREYVDRLRPLDAHHDGSPEEPMMNVMAYFTGMRWHLIVFPRRAHRPAAFFRPDEAQILVSPAVMEMAGMIVTPRRIDFERIDPAMVRTIYSEVSLSDESL